MILSTIRNFFVRLRPQPATETAAMSSATEPAPASRPAMSPGHAASVAVDAPAGRSSRNSGTDADAQESRTATMVETRPTAVKSGRGRGLEGRAGEEVMGLIRRMNEHLDQQSARTERLLDMMERLPQALEALPELNRQNERLVGIITEHLEKASEREHQVNATMMRINQLGEHQAEVLGLIQKHLDAGTQSAAQMNQTLGTLNQSLTEMSQSSTESIRALERISTSSDAREQALAQALGRTQKWMIGSMIVIGGLAAGALVMTAVVLARGMGG